MIAEASRLSGHVHQVTGCFRLPGDRFPQSLQARLHQLDGIPVERIDIDSLVGTGLGYESDPGGGSSGRNLQLVAEQSSAV